MISSQSNQQARLLFLHDECFSSQLVLELINAGTYADDTLETFPCYLKNGKRSALSAEYNIKETPTLIVMNVEDNSIDSRFSGGDDVVNALSSLNP